MANMIARLGVVLGLDSAEFVKGLEGASRRLDQFGKAAEKFGKIGAVAMAAAAVAALKYADQLSDVAEANEVAIGTVVNLSNALANAGGKADDAGKMLTGLTKAIDTAADGSVKVQKAFGSVGVSIGDLQSLDAEGLFKKSLEGLAGISDPMTRNATAMELFGKAAKGVDFKAMNDGFKTGAGVADEQGKAIKDAADAFDMVAQASRDMMQLVMVSVGPALKGLIGYLKDMRGEAGIVGTVFKTVFETVAVLFVDLEYSIMSVGRAMRFLGNLTPEGWKQLNDTQGAHTARRDAAIGTIMRLQAPQDTGDTGMPTAPTVAGGGAGGAKRTITNPFADELAKRKAALDLLTSQIAMEEKRFDLAGQRLDLDDRTFAIRTEELALEDKLAEIERKRLTDLASQKDKSKEVTDAINRESNAAWNLAKRQSETRVAGIEAAHQAQMRAYAAERNAAIVRDIEEQQAITERHEAEQRDNQTALSEQGRRDSVALERAGKLFALEREGRFLRAEDLQLRREIFNIQQDLVEETDRLRRLNLEDMAGNIAAAERLAEIRTGQARTRYAATNPNGSGIDGFGERAAEFFSKLPNEMERGAKAFDAVMSNMDSALNRFVQTGKLAFKDFAASVIRDLIAIELKAQAMSLLKMGLNALGFTSFGGKAGGGMVSQGLPYMVGENGPELFVPQRGGSIVPSNQIGADMGGSPQTVINGPYIANMSAIDTQSGIQFLAKNKNTIWAANMSAQRALPVSR